MHYPLSFSYKIVENSRLEISETVNRKANTYEAKKD